MSEPVVLFVDDEEDLRDVASRTLDLAGLPVQTFADAQDALSHVSRNFPGVLVSDIRMAGMDGLTLMSRCLEIDPTFPISLVTGHGDVEQWEHVRHRPEALGEGEVRDDHGQHERGQVQRKVAEVVAGLHLERKKKYISCVHCVNNTFLKFEFGL